MRRRAGCPGRGTAVGRDRPCARRCARRRGMARLGWTCAFSMSLAVASPPWHCTQVTGENGCMSSMPWWHRSRRCRCRRLRRRWAWSSAGARLAASCEARVRTRRGRPARGAPINHGAAAGAAPRRESLRDSCPVRRAFRSPRSREEGLDDLATRLIGRLASEQLGGGGADVVGVEATCLMTLPFLKSGPAATIMKMRLRRSSEPSPWSRPLRWFRFRVAAELREDEHGRRVSRRLGVGLDGVPHERPISVIVAADRPRRSRCSCRAPRRAFCSTMPEISLVLEEAHAGCAATRIDLASPEPGPVMRAVSPLQLLEDVALDAQRGLGFVLEGLVLGPFEPAPVQGAHQPLDPLGFLVRRQGRVPELGDQVANSALNRPSVEIRFAPYCAP